ncbi:MAG: hypothetical protein NC427_12475 [Ruminococcus flavefaciens]|nr:hypothetical protein [Ruminococcus flavefaciens]
MNQEKVIYDAGKDPHYQNPFIDADEIRQRDMPDGSVMPFRYVHGGFEGTTAKFVFCFPMKERYRGRFYQYLSPFPGPDEEIASLVKSGEDDIIAFCLMNGAYFVETNMESTSAFGGNANPCRLWMSSAAAAEYSRKVAQEYYGCGRPYGYVFGGSGGGYKAIACIENTSAWDGACPYVIGSPYSLPNTITLHAQGMRTLRHAVGKIVDALDAGGSGDMYEGLTEDEARMLREITLMGFPPQAWFIEAAGHWDDGSLPVLMPGIRGSDPRYFKDFWEKPGYLGTEVNSNALRDRLQFKSRVVSVHLPGEELPESGEYANGVDTAWKKALTEGNGAWIELEEVPRGEDLYLKGVNIGFETGDAVGKVMLLGKITGSKGTAMGNGITIGMCYGMDDLEGVLKLVKPGDIVTLDNSDYIAVQSYYRHQVPPDPDFHAWDQFRDEMGSPLIPQRENIMGPGFCGTGTVQEGTIQGKVLLTQALMDESTCPWCGDWYRNTVRRAKGSEEDFRIYYYERCLHGDVSALDTNMIVNYLGGLHQALLDISDWVERGVEPRPSSVYEMEGGCVRIAPTAKERKGMQPVIVLSANGEACTHVKAGEKVVLKAEAQAPEGAGAVTEIQFAFSDPLFGTYAQGEKENGVLDFLKAGRSERVTGELASFVTEDGRNAASASVTTSYDKPGTYFAAAFVKSQRNGDKEDVFTQVRNLARARIVVE